MKISLAEFDAFCKQLSDDWFLEGDECFIPDEFWDGVFNPSEIIDVKANDICLCYQGKEPKSEGERYIDFLKEFKKWKTGIEYEFVGVKIPKGKKDELLMMIKEKFGEMKDD